MLKETVNTRRWRFVAFLVVVVVAAALAAGASSWVANRSAATASPAARHLNRQAFADRLAALGQSDLAPAPTSRFVTIHASLGRNDWALSTYRNAEGKRCLVEQHPGGARAYGCRSDGQIFGQGALFAQWGSEQDSPASRDAGTWDAAWVEGLVKPSVVSVSVVMSDCTTIDAPLSVDGSFFVVIGPELLHARVLPARVEATDAGGKSVASRTISLGPANAAQGNIGGEPYPAPC